MDESEMRRRLAAARVAHLATTGAGGKPHVVPVCFAVDGDSIYFAVDGKPKATVRLKRLDNIAANPSVSLIVDHYEEEWSRLWWVRADGVARTVREAGETGRALRLLTQRYPQYRAAPPPGPVVSISITRLSGWTGA